MSTIYDRLMRSGVRLLLIEDSISDTDLIRIYLEESGSRISMTDTRSLAEAKPHLGENFDVILMDINLPDGHGNQAIQEIYRQKQPEAAIVVITEISDPDTARRMIAMGAQDYITKSELSPESIRKSIVYAIERQHYLKELEKHKNHLEQLVKERTKSLEQSREQYRILAAAFPCGIFRTDADNRCIYVNDKWEEITGYSDEDTLGHHWWEFVNPAEREENRIEWLQFIDDPEQAVYAREIQLLCKSGTVLWTEIQARKIDRHADSGAVGLLRDITKTKSLIEQLRRLREWR